MHPLIAAGSTYDPSMHQSELKPHSRTDGKYIKHSDLNLGHRLAKSFQVSAKHYSMRTIATVILYIRQTKSRLSSLGMVFYCAFTNVSYKFLEHVRAQISFFVYNNQTREMYLGQGDFQV